MDASSLPEEEDFKLKRYFNLLKPCCTTLLENPSIENILLLQDVIEEIDGHFLCILQTYLLHPILLILRTFRNKSERLELAGVICIRIILKKISELNHYKLFFELFNVLSCTLTEPTNLAVLPRSEEIKHEIVLCFIDALEKASKNIIENFYTLTIVPFLSHVVTLLLALAEKENLRSLKIDSMKCLQKLMLNDEYPGLNELNNNYMKNLYGERQLKTSRKKSNYRESICNSNSNVVLRENNIIINNINSRKNDENITCNKDSTSKMNKSDLNKTEQNKIDLHKTNNDDFINENFNNSINNNNINNNSIKKSILNDQIIKTLNHKNDDNIKCNKDSTSKMNKSDLNKTEQNKIDLHKTNNENFINEKSNNSINNNNNSIKKSILNDQIIKTLNDLAIQSTTKTDKTLSHHTSNSNNIISSNKAELLNNINNYPINLTNESTSKVSNLKLQTSRIFISFLPGISICMKDISLANEKQGWKVTCTALETLAVLLLTTFSDPVLQKLDPLSTFGGEEKFATWIDSTSQRIKILISLIIKQLANDQHSKIKQQLIVLAFALTRFCFSSLKDCSKLAIEVLLQMSIDELPDIAESSTNLLYILKVHFEDSLDFNDVLEENFMTLVSCLPKKLAITGNKKRFTILQTIRGYLQLIGTNMSALTLSQSSTADFITGLIQIIEFQIGPTIEVIDEDSMVSNYYSLINRPKYHFSHSLDDQVINEASQICSLIGKFSEPMMAFDLFSDALIGGGINYKFKKQAAFCLIEMLKGLPKLKNINSEVDLFGIENAEKVEERNISNLIESLVKHVIDIFSELLPSLSNTAINDKQIKSHRNYSLLNSSQDGKKKTLTETLYILKKEKDNNFFNSSFNISSNTIILPIVPVSTSFTKNHHNHHVQRKEDSLLACLLLDLISECSNNLGGQFESCLVDSLYPMLVALGCGNRDVSIHAFFALKQIAKNTLIEVERGEDEISKIKTEENNVEMARRIELEVSNDYKEKDLIEKKTSIENGFNDSLTGINKNPEKYNIFKITTNNKENQDISSCVLSNKSNLDDSLNIKSNHNRENISKIKKVESEMSAISDLVASYSDYLTSDVITRLKNVLMFDDICPLLVLRAVFQWGDERTLLWLDGSFQKIMSNFDEQYTDYGLQYLITFKQLMLLISKMNPEKSLSIQTMEKIDDCKKNSLAIDNLANKTQNYITCSENNKAKPISEKTKIDKDFISIAELKSIYSKDKNMTKLNKFFDTTEESDEEEFDLEEELLKFDPNELKNNNDYFKSFSDPNELNDNDYFKSFTEKINNPKAYFEEKNYENSSKNYSGKELCEIKLPPVDEFTREICNFITDLHQTHKEATGFDDNSHLSSCDGDDENKLEEIGKKFEEDIKKSKINNANLNINKSEINNDTNITDENITKSDENLNDFEPMNDEVAKKDASLPHINMIKQILERCQNFLVYPDPQFRLVSLELISIACRVMKQHKDDFLPLVHILWKPFVRRFSDSEHFIVIKAFHTLRLMGEAAGDFICRRLTTDIIPTVVEKLKSLSAKSYKAPMQYRFSAACQLQQCILSNLGPLCLNASIKGETLGKIFDATTPYLSIHQPKCLQEGSISVFTELDKINGDWTWLILHDLHCPSNRRLDNPPSALVEKLEVFGLGKNDEFTENVLKLMNILNY